MPAPQRGPRATPHPTTTAPPHAPTDSGLRPTTSQREAPSPARTSAKMSSPPKTTTSPRAAQAIASPPRPPRPAADQRMQTPTRTLRSQPLTSPQLMSPWMTPQRWMISLWMTARPPHLAPATPASNNKTPSRPTPDPGRTCGHSTRSPPNSPTAPATEVQVPDLAVFSPCCPPEWNPTQANNHRKKVFHRTDTPRRPREFAKVRLQDRESHHEMNEKSVPPGPDSS